MQKLTQASLNRLISKVSESISNQGTFDSHDRRGPVQELKYQQAVHACAACARLFEANDRAFFRDLAPYFAGFGRPSALSTVSAENIAVASRQIVRDLSALQAAARARCLKKFENAELPGKIRLLRPLVALGETALVDEAIAGMDGVSERDTFGISQLLLRSQSLHRNADINARRLFSSDPDFVMQSGEPPSFLFSGNGFVPELSQPADLAKVTLPVVLFHIDYLKAQDRFSEAIEIAQSYLDQSPSSHIPKSLAMRVMQTLVRLDLPRDQRRKLADPIIPLQSKGLDPKDWFPVSVRKAASQATGPTTWLELSSWAISLLAITKGCAPSDDAQQALWDIAFPNKQDVVHDALASTGYQPANPYSTRLQFPFLDDSNAEDFVSEAAISRTQTKRAKEFLRQAADHSTGTVLFSFHSSDLRFRGSVPSVAAARLGITTLSFHGGLSKKDGKESALISAAVRNLPFQIVTRSLDTGPEVTTKVLTNLRQGGLLDIAVDVVGTAGITSTIPWFLQPISVPTYPATLAVSLNCKIGISATWVSGSGHLINDIVALDLPPDQGDLATRSAWLSQKLGRACRAFAMENAVPITSPTMRIRGGVAKRQNLIPLQEWASDPETAGSLMAWLAAPQHGAGQEALKISRQSLSFEALQSLTLRMASLFLHYQSETPRHQAINRDTSDQHRIMLVLPQGAAFLAASLAGLSVGSMVALSQDDLATKQMVARYREFKPDIVIATASAWARLCAADAQTAQQTFLIIEDSGDQAALEDLVLSFPEADRLPPLRPGAPGLVVFTSGSTGAPKGVVHPCTALHRNPGGQGIGADALFGLSSRDRLTYVARWESVCLLDILSALRAQTTVCVPDPDMLLSPRAMGLWLKKESVTCFTAPATIFGVMLQSDAMSCSQQPALRLTMPWGERISTDVTRQLYQKFPDAEHIASYGASEALWVSFGPLPQGDNGTGTMAGPGGTLIPGVDTVLVDETGAEVSLGEIGHPRVRGPGVMLGYFDELMANHAAALPSPRSSTVVLQDFARQTDDGDLELLGRSDSVIKIAGRRISLLEIESAAEMTPRVTGALALLDSREGVAQVLVAVTHEGGKDDDVSAAVTRSIGEHCFSSARPARVLVLKSFPNLPSGKRDRKAVEALLQDCAPAPSVPPGDTTETTMANFSPLLKHIARWAIVRFHLPENSFDPNAQIPFLDSLMVMELLLIAETVCGTVLPFCALNQHRESRWADLAAEIEHAGECSQTGDRI